MRVIVTGGAGFIGSAVCRRFAGVDGWEVVNLDMLTYAADLRNVASVEGMANYRFVRGDICDSAGMERLFAEFRPDAVVHLAAESHVDRSIAGSDAFIRTNVVGTHTLLEAARSWWDRQEPGRKARFRFVHVSTDEVYGSLGETGLFAEETPYDPRSPYSATKAASDHLASAWFHTYGLPVMISNCSNNYGPYQFPEKLIPLMILNALEGVEMPVYGDGRNVRDWLFVDDHVMALRAILLGGRPGETYNVGGRSERTNIDVVERICDLVDERADPLACGPRRSLIRFVADRPGHDRRYAIDASKLERELGWRPGHAFDAGLSETVDWYLSHPHWRRPVRGEPRAPGGPDHGGGR
jgi:dTDP-glucose 4,6-dehydratase